MANRTHKLVPPTGLVGLYPYKERPWTAQKLVSDVERRVLAAEQWLEDNQWAPMVDALYEDQELRQDLYLPADPMLHHHVTMTALEVGVHRLWGQDRVVLDVHPGMIPFLRASESDKFPPMVLKHLPYPNPLVFLGSPVNMTDSAGKPIRLLGWYVAGMTERHQYVDTTDDRAQAFHLTALSEVMSDDGKAVLDWDYCRVTLPVTGADATVGELIAAGLERFHWDPSIPGQTEDSQKQYMSDLLHVLIPHMLYLVAQNLEAKPQSFHSPAPPRRNKWDRKRGGGKVSRYLVGWQSGAVLASPEHWGEETVEPGGEKGPQGLRRSPRAHVRRAHFHTYRVGEGRRDRKVKWLAPIPINAGNTPEVGKTTQSVKVR